MYAMLRRMQNFDYGGNAPYRQSSRNGTHGMGRVLHLAVDLVTVGFPPGSAQKKKQMMHSSLGGPSDL